MKIDLSLVKRVVVGSVFLLGFQTSQAALVGAVKYNPDLSTFSASLDYSFTELCTSSNGGAGVEACGTRSKGKDWDTYSEADSFGVLTVSGSSMVLDAYSPSTGLDGIVGGSYSLIANFDGTGSFVDGTVSGTGTAGSGDPNFQSGTIVTGSLTDFGYSGVDDAGTFDFFFDSVGGDFAAFYNGYGGIILTTTTMSPAVGNWDTGGLDFLDDFAASSANVDTVVPIPASAWLFGTGLLSLLGLRRRNRKNV